MIIDSIEFRGYSCFSNHWTALEKIKPINVIIGRNNSGKSHLIDMIKKLCDKESYHKGIEYRCGGILDATSLQMQFKEGISDGILCGKHWRDHGQRLCDKSMRWHVNSSSEITELDADDVTSPYGGASTDERLKRLRLIAQNAQHCLGGRKFRRLLADRDISPEPESMDLTLGSDGTGATNIVRRYILSSNPRLPRELIQNDLLGALRAIFAGDGEFNELQIQVHDEADGDDPQGRWEIYVGEENKGLMPLSRSGSGLKTVILVLLNLLVIPEITRAKKAEFVFAFEELENNLHPALLRRLFRYLDEYSQKENATIFLTTHSSVALDFFGVADLAQIIHVAHDGSSARGRAVSTHFDHLGVISELGAKPSDLLQANGVVWVEGPSDRVYINRWIDLFSDGCLREGKDYQCAFYGGALLARTQFKSPEEAEKELVNLFRLNSNIAVVCDGDRNGPRARLKERVCRISEEVKAIPGSTLWITQAREIENYLPGSVISSAFRLASLPDPEKHEPFFPRKRKKAEPSYLEAKMRRKTVDKMELAVQVSPYMTKEMMTQRFDLADQLNAIVSSIRRWNT